MQQFKMFVSKLIFLIVAFNLYISYSTVRAIGTWKVGITFSVDRLIKLSGDN